jgi:tellurite resistance protein TehA-like permease
MKMQLLSYLIKLAIQDSSLALLASVIGTGIFAIASQFYSFLWSGHNVLAILLWGISSIFFLGVTIPWIMSWFFSWDNVLKIRTIQ